MEIALYNTMSRTIERFASIKPDQVGMYCCGPTVYNFAHIGNLRTYVFEDLLARTLRYAGYRVNHVMNITDVGHLSDDGDDGEDKMLKSSRESGRDVYEIARFFTEAFFKDADALNILKPTTACKATEHVQDMIELVQQLERKGHTYVAGGNVYFSIDTFPRYGELARLDLDELKSGARIEVDQNKRNPKDFVLWFTNSKFTNQAMTWDSPWGRGYPGWHLECSAMSMKYLGDSFDIHCGGIDHIPVHHTNEIAQSEAATGKKWVKYWVHGEFLVQDTGKMSKSKGEFLTLALLRDHGYDPLDYRYFCLGGHYRQQLLFSWQSLDASRNARRNLHAKTSSLKSMAHPDQEVSGKALEWLEEFVGHMGNDLHAPRALATMWGMLKDDSLAPAQTLACLLEMDKILGLGLDSVCAATGDACETVPEHILAMVEERAMAKKQKNFARADELRAIVEQEGWHLKDTPDGTTVTRNL